jgi:tRNA(Ile)-lysidine synthase
MPNPWIEQLQSRIKHWIEQGTGTTWVVAVSGGSDSVGLLRSLHALAADLGLKLSVAHLNHGVRGEAAQADADFVASLAQSLELPFDLGHWSPQSTSHFESAARRARYAWLAEIATARGATAIAVGHTMDDQAETILHRILRGTGPRGLAGMQPIRRIDKTSKIRLVRPLLTVPRAAIRDYLATLNQPYREDETNTDPSHTRARIRHDLLPKLATDYNPNITAALVQLGKLARSSQQAVANDARTIVREALLHKTNESLVLRHGYLQDVPLFLRTEVLRHLWRKAGWPEADMSATRWTRMAELVGQPKFRPTAIGAGVTISIEKQRFLLLHRSQPPTPAPEPPTRPVDPQQPIHLQIPGITPIPWANGSIITTTDPNAPSQESISLKNLTSPLTIRRPTPGDRFAPLGMKGQSKPLADFFRAQKVPKHLRSRTPLLCDAQGIIWVIGHRIADRVKVHSPADSTIGLTWQNGLE